VSSSVSAVWWLKMSRPRRRAGFSRGDVVLSVDGTPVQSVAQLRKMSKEHESKMRC